jgi:hypothetical protein
VGKSYERGSVIYFCCSHWHLGHHVARKEVALIKAQLTMPKGPLSITKENSPQPHTLL